MIYLSHQLTQKGFGSLAICVIAWCFSSALQAGENSVVYNYEISADKAEIGRLTEQRSKDNQGVKIIRNTEIKINTLFGNYEVANTDIYRVSNGKIQSILHLVAEGNKVYRTEGQRRDSGLWFSRGYIQNIATLEEDALSDSAVAVAISAVPYLGLALSLLSDPVPAGDMLLKSSDYDATVFEIPYLSPAKQPYRLLDTETLKVEKYALKFIDNELCYTDIGEPLPCRKVIAENSQFNFQYWLSEDAFGPYLIRLQGEDGDGPYTLRLVTTHEN